jgi:hypothetical protein
MQDWGGFALNKGERFREPLTHNESALFCSSHVSRAEIAAQW